MTSVRSSLGDQHEYLAPGGPGDRIGHREERHRAPSNERPTRASQDSGGATIIAAEDDPINRYAGLDWASEIHAVCVIDETGEVRERLRVPHTRLGLAELVSRLARHAEPALLPVGVERSDGPVIEALRAGGFPIVVIPPHTVKAARPRFGAANVKSDPAMSCARWPTSSGPTAAGCGCSTPSDPATVALRRLVRTRGELVAERTRLANRLRCLLEDAWPGAAEIFARVDSPIGLDFLERYPKPAPGPDARRGAARLVPRPPPLLRPTNGE